MARIDIATIPNAPQGIGAPMQQSRGVQANIAGAAQFLQQPEQRGIDGAAFQAPFQGAQEIGNAIAGAGQIVSKLAEDMGKAQDVISYSQAQNYMTEYMSGKQNEFQKTQPTEWKGSFEKDLPQLREKLNQLRVSPKTAEAITADYIRWEGHSMADIQFDSTKRSLAEGNLANDTAIERAYLAGNMGLAETLGSAAVAAGMKTPAQWDAQLFELKQRQTQETITAAISNNPVGLREEMDAAEKNGGETESFGYMRPSEIASVRKRASTEARNQAIETRQSVQNGILVGDITAEEEIRMAVKGTDISEKEIKSMTKMITSNVQFDPETAATLKVAVMAYDAAGDPNMEKWHALNDQIVTKLPKEEAQKLSGELNKSWEYTVREKKAKDPKQAYAAEMLGAFVTLGKQGFYGETGLSAEKGESDKVTDIAKNRAMWTTIAEKQALMESWLKDNPNASPEEGNKQFLSLVTKDVSQAAIKSLDQRAKFKTSGLPPPFGSPFSFTRQPAPTDNDAMLKNIDAIVPRKDGTPDGPSPFDSKEPAAIRYNNPGAMYPGPSAEKFGAVGFKTIGGGHKIAVFDNPISGAAAQFDLLNTRYTGQTLGDAIKKWSGGNSVPTYMAVIKRETGLDASTMLTPEIMQNPKLAIPIAKAMAKQESGKDYPLSDDEWISAYNMGMGG